MICVGRGGKEERELQKRGRAPALMVSRVILGKRGDCPSTKMFSSYLLLLLLLIF